jgi:predicted nucleotidyltransferase
MAESGLSDADWEKIVEWATRHRLIERVHLFGSRARGDHGPDSDIDLAFEMDYEASFDWRLRYDKAPDLRLSHPVDLWWYRPNAELDIGKGVRQEGILIYERAHLCGTGEETGS